MNTTAKSTPPTTSFRWLILPCAVLLAVCLLVAGLVSFVQLSGGACCLRKSLTQAIASQRVTWNKVIEINLGSLTFQTARAALSFVRLDPDVRKALQSVRGAEVGVYQLNPDSAFLDLPSLLSAADEAMTSRGWSRLVGVNKERDLVAVYVPADQTNEQNVQACVAVINSDRLVVVSARSNLEPLMELACKGPVWQHQHWLPTRL